MNEKQNEKQNDKFKARIGVALGVSLPKSVNLTREEYHIVEYAILEVLGKYYDIKEKIKEVV